MPTLPAASTRTRSLPFVANAKVVVPGLNIPVFVLPVKAYEGALAAVVPGLAAKGQLRVEEALAGSHCEPFHISTWLGDGADAVIRRVPINEALMLVSSEPSITGNLPLASSWTILLAVEPTS